MKEVMNAIFDAIEYGMDTSEENCMYAHSLSDCFYVTVDENPINGVYIDSDLEYIHVDEEIFTDNEIAEIERLFKAIVDDVDFECKSHTGKGWR